ncbi:MAG TPA: pilus assembly PilX N-terminal domain-containing protein [Desulfuromonadales bacterium]|nr:pilus assembly PilX N-terminal domain-containing protein [Desulfuromonadales bacterium]
MPIQTLARNNRQRGMALIIAIGFLAILSILGAVVLNVATRDIGVSATFMPARQAFYTADRAVEYALNRDILVRMNQGDTIILADDTPGTDETGTEQAIAADGTSVLASHKAIVEAGDAQGELRTGSIEDLGPKDLPPVMKQIHGSDFGANLYHVEVEAEATGTGDRSHINASIVRLFKLDDDTIFRTSGGG